MKIFGTNPRESQLRNDLKRELATVTSTPVSFALFESLVVIAGQSDYVQHWRKPIYAAAYRAKDAGFSEAKTVRLILASNKRLFEGMEAWLIERIVKAVFNSPRRD